MIIDGETMLLGAHSPIKRIVLVDDDGERTILVRTGTTWSTERQAPETMETRITPNEIAVYLATDGRWRMVTGRNSVNRPRGLCFRSGLKERVFRYYASKMVSAGILDEDSGPPLRYRRSANAPLDHEYAARLALAAGEQSETIRSEVRAQQQRRTKQLMDLKALLQDIDQLRAELVALIEREVSGDGHFDSFDVDLAMFYQHVTDIFSNF